MALKSEKLIEKFGINDKLKVDDKSGVIGLPDDFYEQSLEDGKVGLTLDQVKKLQKHDAELMAATTLAAGQAAAAHFKGNPEMSEMSMSYHHGQNTTHAHFERESTTPIRNVVEVKGLDSGELGKVHKHVKSLFDDINS